MWICFWLLMIIVKFIKPHSQHVNWTGLNRPEQVDPVIPPGVNLSCAHAQGYSDWQQTQRTRSRSEQTTADSAMWMFRWFVRVENSELGLVYVMWTMLCVHANWSCRRCVIVNVYRLHVNHWHCSHNMRSRSIGNGRVSVCPSVCLVVRPAHASTANMLLWARQAGDIDRILHAGA